MTGAAIWQRLFFMGRASIVAAPKAQTKGEPLRGYHVDGFLPLTGRVPSGFFGSAALRSE